VIDLPNHAVHTVERGRDYGCSRCTQIRQGPRVIVRIVAEQALNYWVCSYELAGNRHRSQADHSHGFTLSLVVREKEGLILDDGSAERATKLVVVERGLGAGRVEEVARIECVVAEVFDCRSVKRVRSAFGHDVNHRSGIPAVFRLVIGENTQLADRVDRQDGGRRPENACLIDGRIVAVAVVHVRAVEQIVVGAPARPVHGKLAE